MSWSEVTASAVVDRWGEFLVPTDLVDDATEDPARVGIVEALRSLPTPKDAVRGAVAATRDRIRYDDSATGVTTTAAQAWEVGGGVCQDYSHTLLSLLRSLTSRPATSAATSTTRRRHPAAR